MAQTPGNMTASDTHKPADTKESGPENGLTVPAEKNEKDQTYIEHRVKFVDNDGNPVDKVYRMKTEDFTAVAAEKGW